jgi:hypothetical protein
MRPSPPLPSLDPPEAPSLPCLLLHPKPWRRKLPPPNPPPPLPEFAGGSPEDVADEPIHHLLHLFLARDQGEGHPEASSSSSPSTHGGTQIDLLQRRPTPTNGPLLMLYMSSVSFPHQSRSPFCSQTSPSNILRAFRVSSPLITLSSKYLMHVKSITWNQLYTLLETHRNKPHPKPRSEPPPASSTVSHGSAADSLNVHVGQSVIKIKTSRDDFGFSGSRGQSAPSARTVRNLRGGRSAISSRTVHSYYSSSICHLV